MNQQKKYEVSLRLPTTSGSVWLAVCLPEAISIMNVDTVVISMACSRGMAPLVLGSKVVVALIV